MRRNGNMGKAKKGTFKRLAGFVFKRHKFLLILVMACILIGTVSSVVMSSFTKNLVDNCITPGITNGFDSIKTKLIKLILSVAVVFLASALASFIYRFTLAKITQTTLRDLRNECFNKMQTLPIKYFDTHKHGDTMSIYTNDTDAIRELIGEGFPAVVQAAVTLIGIFSLMLCYSIWLTLLVIATLFVMSTVTKKLGGRSGKFMMEQQKSLAAEEGFVQETLNGQKVVKVFCHEQKSKEAFDKYNEELFKNSETAHMNGNVLMPILGNMGNILYVLVAIVGALLVTFEATNVSILEIGPLTIGTIVAFLGMSRQASQTIGQTSMQINTIAMGLAGASRVFDLLDEKPEEDNGYVTLVNARFDENGNLTESDTQTGIWAWRHPHKADGTVTYEQVKGDIRLEDVDFAYEEGKNVLHDVSLFAKPGQKIAFVGATGAGKTTITNLINRFYDIPDGKIRYDGINITKINKSDLRRSLGVVLQDVNLFTGTVMENIRYGRLDATDEECIDAAKLANAHELIMSLPDGYNTMLKSNGSSLSQGQRQLISIARAAVANPPVMILDEATSSIDTRTEAIVQRGMDNLMKGRTVFVIAHRLSTVRNSEAIMVLDHGKIIERGDHNSLIEQKGMYYKLYTGAFELE